MYNLSDLEALLHLRVGLLFAMERIQIIVIIQLKYVSLGSCPRLRIFHCDISTCLHGYDICDGYPICLDGADENNCGSMSLCNTVRILWTFKSLILENCSSIGIGYTACDSTTCMPPSDICDGYPVCEDNTDELSCGD